MVVENRERSRQYENVVLVESNAALVCYFVVKNERLRIGAKITIPETLGFSNG